MLYDNDVTQSKRDADDIMQFSLWLVSPEQPWHLLSALVLITAKLSAEATMTLNKTSSAVISHCLRDATSCRRNICQARR